MLAVTVGRPSIWITQPSWSNFQSGSSVWPLRHRTLSSTTTLSPSRPFQLAATPATQPDEMVHDPRSRSAVVCAYSASHRISSSSTPSASATIRTASAKTAVPWAVIDWSSG